jgi:aminopeptidase N
VSRILRIASCLAWSGIFPLLAGPLLRPYTVESYDVRIRPDLAKQSLDGEVSIRFHSLADTPVSALELDAATLQIASVAEGQTTQWFERKGAMLVVVLTEPLRAEEHRTITIRYRAGAAPGLKFFPDQLYTLITSDWMPCNDRPGERATLHLTLAAPPDAKVAATGLLTATRPSEAESITEWQLDAAAAPYWFGFALGRFAENNSEAEGVKLRVLGASAEVFEATTAAMKYLADRSGKHYPGAGYTQVFVHGDAPHAMAAGLTFLPETYAQGLAAKQPEALSGLTSDLAHQWYGIGIAWKDWSDIWLSDGISAFLGDTFLEQRLGNVTYEKQVEHSRQLYNQLRAEGKDRPLDFTDWTTRQDAGGDIPAFKGICFLYLLHALVGDSAFWDGLRTYTTRQWNQTASSEDFQHAFGAMSLGKPNTGKKSGSERKNSGKKEQKNSPKTLDSLFDLWVYGMPNTVTK